MQYKGTVEIGPIPNPTALHKPAQYGNDVSRESGLLSVVVPSVNGLNDLRGCLAALLRDKAHEHLEVLVPERCGEDVRLAIHREFPTVRLLPVESATTIPEMRALGFRHATGTAVAVIEDHVIVPRAWARRLLDEIAGGALVVGGPVENAATHTLLDRAAFFCEYSHCMPPLPRGATTWLPGNNVAYRRDVLERYRPITEAGRWEDYLHDHLRRDGIELVCRPEIQVEHDKHYTFTEYVSQRYLYAR